MNLTENVLMQANELEIEDKLDMAVIRLYGEKRELLWMGEVKAYKVYEIANKMLKKMFTKDK